MSSNDLNTWVSDKLMVLLGYSQTAVVKYLIAMAKKSKSPAELVRELVDYGFSSSSDTRAFAEEIYARDPRKTAGVNLYQQQEAEAAMLLRKQKTFALLEADHDEDEGNVEKQSASGSRKSDKRPKRFRKKIGQPEDDDDEVVIVREDERNVRRKVSQGEDDGTESEEERLRDQREREELEQHLRERDTARTRKLTEPKMSKKEQEEVARRDNAGEKGDMKSLRKFSRQEYLKKREQQKLQELKDELEDEQYLFGDEKLPETEIHDFRYKKEMYELLNKSTQEADNVGEYRMPDAYDQEGGVNQEKRFAVALQNYRDMDSAEKMNPFAEQEAWEDHQIGKATLNFGAKNKQASDNYGFVFEDQIAFIKASVLAGDNYEEEMHAKPSQGSMRKSVLDMLQEERKKLPIYSYRDQLLKAVKDHQVRSMKRARDIRDQLEGLLERVEIEVSSNSNGLDSIRKSIVAGFFPHTAKLQKNGSYRTVKHPQTVHIHPASGLSQVLPRWVVYHQLVLTSKEYMRQVTELKPEWLIEIAPHYYQRKDVEDATSKKMPKTSGLAAM